MSDLVLVVALGILGLGVTGAVASFTAMTKYYIIDAPVVRALEAARCPHCRKLMGKTTAEAAESEIAKEDAGIRMVQGGYVPSALTSPHWKVQCPHCQAPLTFDVAERVLRTRQVNSTE